MNGDDKLTDCIFIANIPNTLTSQEVEQELKDLFSKFGNIDYVKFSKDNCSRPYSFLKFHQGIDFDIISTKKWFLRERQLRIEPAKSQKQSKFKDLLKYDNINQVSPPQTSYLFLLSARLQIDNLNPEVVTRQRLWSLLNHQYGPIIKIYIHYFDKSTKRSIPSPSKTSNDSYSNIGMIVFIDFANISNAERCFQIENGSEWFGMKVTISKVSESDKHRYIPPNSWYSPNINDNNITSTIDNNFFNDNNRIQDDVNEQNIQ